MNAISSLRRLRALLLASLVGLVLPACVSDHVVATFGDGAAGGDGRSGDATVPQSDAQLPSGGTGTNSLRVDATISASEERDNASVAADFRAELTVDVTRGDGSPVTDAQVVVSSAGGEVTLAHQGGGRYEGTQNGYWQSYGLRVIAGSERVEGVRGVGPAIHTFTAPTENAIHPAGSPLEVRWQPAGGTDEATLETDDFARQTVSDSGSFTVPAAALSGKAGEDQEDRVRVRRTTVQPIDGGLAGSDLTVRLRNEVSFIIRG